MIRAIIIEDEPNGQELLSQLLQTYVKNVKVIGMASSVGKGVDLIQNESPDLVFMDYQIEGGNGFDILDQIEDPRFKVIFITGYSDYAIKAFKYAALDYLLKPIEIEELIAAVKRYQPTIKNYKNNYEVLKTNLDTSDNDDQQLLILNSGEYRAIKIKDILSIKADLSYVEITLINGKKLITTDSLKHYEELLPQSHFFKTHKSYIVNLKMVASVEQGRGGFVTLTTEVKVPIATRRKSIFLKRLKELANNK